MGDGRINTVQTDATAEFAVIDPRQRAIQEVVAAFRAKKDGLVPSGHSPEVDRCTLAKFLTGDPSVDAILRASVCRSIARNENWLTGFLEALADSKSASES